MSDSIYNRHNNINSMVESLSSHESFLTRNKNILCPLIRALIRRWEEDGNSCHFLHPVSFPTLLSRESVLLTYIFVKIVDGT